MVQTRSQTKAKAANAPTVQSTTRKPVTQSIIHRIDKIPIKTNKDPKPNINTQTQLQNTALTQQLPQSLIGPEYIQIPISTHPSVRLPPKPPDTVGQGATPSPNLVQNPNIDFEENSPHQERINYYRNIHKPRAVVHRTTPGIDKFSEYFKISAEIPSKTGRYRQNS